MKNLVTIPALCLLFLIACANTSQHPAPSSKSYDGIWEGSAQTGEGHYDLKMEIKDGIMSGILENSNIKGYIDADNKLNISPFSAFGAQARLEVDRMSPDRIEGTVISLSIRDEWFVVKQGTAKPDIIISNIKVNEKEPWTGKFKVDSTSQGGGIWAMKQNGQSVESTTDSAYEFKGTVEGNQLKGKIVGTSSTYYTFTLEMSSDNMSFTGILDLLAHSNRGQLKGKRIE